MNWEEALRLPREVQEFLDEYLEGQLSLPVVEDCGVPIYLGVPSMLLFRIGESKHSCCAQLKEKVESAERRGQRCVIVSGASGCGKTRSSYDLLCERDGFYFVVTASLNGGSRDLEVLIEVLNRGGLLVRNPQPNPQAESFQDLDLNGAVVKVLAMLLLACRMKMYLYCKSKGITSREWLLLQAACRGLAPRQGGPALLRDPFREFFEGAVEKLCGLSRKHIASQREPLLRHFTGPVPIPTVVLDEAQEAMKLFDDGYFWSRSRRGYVPLANCLEGAFRVDNFEHKHVVMVSGTGYTLYFQSDHLFGSGLCKIIADSDFVNFGIWKDVSEMIDYAEQAIELPEDEKVEMKALFPVFKGRFRPLASVLEVMILNNTSLRKAAAYVTAGVTTRKKTYYEAVSRLAEERAYVLRVNLVQELETAVVQYFGAGKGYEFRESTCSWEACVALIDAGLGWLERTDSGSCVVHVDEYLVLAAARNYFQDQHEARGIPPSDYLPSTWLRLTATVPYPSGQGLRLHNFVALSFESMWAKHGGVLADMPLFEPLLRAKGCPRDFRELIARQRGEVVKGWIDGFVSADGYSPEVFLADLKKGEPLCTTWISGDSTAGAGADAVRGIRYKANEGGDEKVYVMHVLEQHKFPKNQLSWTDIVKTGFREDTEAYKLLSGIQLRLLVMPPQSKGDHGSHFWETHADNKSTGFVILDGENAADLFGNESAPKFLARMKFDSSAMLAEIEDRKRRLPPPPREIRFKTPKTCSYVRG